MEDVENKHPDWDNVQITQYRDKYFPQWFKEYVSLLLFIVKYTSLTFDKIKW